MNMVERYTELCMQIHELVQVAHDQRVAFYELCLQTPCLRDSMDHEVFEEWMNQ